MKGRRLPGRTVRALIARRSHHPWRSANAIHPAPCTLHPTRALSLLGLLALTACSSLPPQPETSVPPRKPGGYYLDDGPGANAPANLDQISSPEPKVEPIKASTSRPYTVFGRTYTPMTRLGPYQARGTASWYGMFRPCAPPSPSRSRGGDRVSGSEELRHASGTTSSSATTGRSPRSDRCGGRHLRRCAPRMGRVADRSRLRRAMLGVSSWRALRDHNRSQRAKQRNA